MSTAVQIKLKLDEVLSNHNSAHPRKNVLEDDDEYNTPTINDVESIERAVIKTSKNETQAPYNILLVGETGVGKSSVVEFIANVLAGNDVDHYNFDILDRTNELGCPNHRSQTNSARLYEFTSKNGIVVRILDTPGLADTRGLQHDELHKQCIGTQIKNHIGSINAVLVLANGAVPCVKAGTDDALSTFTAMFPKSLAHDVSFMFTNVSDPLHWNCSLETIPHEFRGAPQFLLNNPVALQKENLKLKDDPNMKKTKADLRNAVKTSEESALQMLVKLFDWLDGLEPQPTTENDRVPTGQTATVKAKCMSNHTLEQSNTVGDDSQAQSGKMRGSLVQMLVLLKRKMQKGIRKVLWNFFGK